jgi:hypothetical protein
VEDGRGALGRGFGILISNRVPQAHLAMGRNCFTIGTKTLRASLGSRRAKKARPRTYQLKSTEGAQPKRSWWEEL